MDSRLIEAVREQMGYNDADNRDQVQEFVDTCRDVCRGGADASFGGFTYYRDTVEFFDNNRRRILNLAADMADNFGQSVAEMVAGFNYLNGFTTWDVEKVLFFASETDDEEADNSDNETMVKNALAWFAQEEVARYVDDNSDEFLPEEEGIDVE